MSFEAVRHYFDSCGLASRIRVLDQSSATVELAAAALGCEPRRIAKSLALGVAGRPILVIMAGDARLDNAKYKALFAIKPSMLSPDETAQKIGHAVGGVCPFALCPGVEVYLDRSLSRFDSVFPACGSANSVIELTLSELETHSGASDWIDVGKDWA